MLVKKLKDPRKIEILIDKRKRKTIVPNKTRRRQSGSAAKRTTNMTLVQSLRTYR
jgi:hypothetical protein